MSRGLLAALVLTFLAGPAGAGWWDDLDRGESVRLDDVLAQPDRYRRKVLSFYCVFHGTDEVFMPLATPFNRVRYENLAVWPDGAPLWEEGAYRRDVPFLYIERSHPQHDEVLRIESFTRIEVTGRIRSVWRNRPCIEVLSLRRTGHRLGRAVVVSVMAGDRHSEAESLELAYENYRRALQPDLPPAYDLLVRKKVAETLRRLGRHAEADQVEGGTILGAAPPPEADPSRLGSPLPDEPPAGAAPTAPLADDLPGVPRPLTEDLPGEPAAPSPITRDLPGEPDALGAPPAGAAPPPEGPPPAGEQAPPEEEEEEEAPPPVPPAPAGAPPRRSPRLTGVK